MLKHFLLYLFVFSIAVMPGAFAQEVPFYLQKSGPMPERKTPPASSTYKKGRNPYVDWVLKRAARVIRELKVCYSEFAPYSNAQTNDEVKEKTWALRKIQKKSEHLDFLMAEYKSRMGHSWSDDGFVIDPETPETVTAAYKEYVAQQKTNEAPRKQKGKPQAPDSGRKTKREVVVAAQEPKLETPSAPIAPVAAVVQTPPDEQNKSMKRKYRPWMQSALSFFDEFWFFARNLCGSAGQMASKAAHRVMPSQAKATESRLPEVKQPPSKAAETVGAKTQANEQPTIDGIKTPEILESPTESLIDNLAKKAMEDVDSDASENDKAHAGPIEPVIAAMQTDTIKKRVSDLAMVNKSVVQDKQTSGNLASLAAPVTKNTTKSEQAQRLEAEKKERESQASIAAEQTRLIEEKLKQDRELAKRQHEETLASAEITMKNWEPCYPLYPCIPHKNNLAATPVIQPPIQTKPTLAAPSPEQSNTKKHLTSTAVMPIHKQEKKPTKQGQRHASPKLALNKKESHNRKKESQLSAGQLRTHNLADENKELDKAMKAKQLAIDKDKKSGLHVAKPSAADSGAINAEPMAPTENAETKKSQEKPVTTSLPSESLLRGDEDDAIKIEQKKNPHVVEAPAKQLAAPASEAKSSALDQPEEATPDPSKMKDSDLVTDDEKSRMNELMDKMKSKPREDARTKELKRSLADRIKDQPAPALVKDTKPAQTDTVIESSEIEEANGPAY
jgi:hypothetical protein